jgi:hypothetical protein
MLLKRLAITAGSILLPAVGAAVAGFGGIDLIKGRQSL